MSTEDDPSFSETHCLCIMNRRLFSMNTLYQITLLTSFFVPFQVSISQFQALQPQADSKAQDVAVHDLIDFWSHPFHNETVPLASFLVSKNIWLDLL